MKEETKNQKHIIQSAFWDYEFPTEELLAVVHGRQKMIGHLDREKIFLRILNYLNWYDFIQIVKPQEMTEVINERFLEKVNNPELKTGLSYVIELLQRKIIPSTG